jgi:lysylphosphatidylglycerol synthetase-like protein (DUF2156 family)
MAAVVKEPARRIVSPVLLVLAGLCFLLPFAGVSCNTTAASAELGSISSLSQQLGEQASSWQSQELTSCLNSLKNYDAATYTGLDLAAGSAPTVASSAPSGCGTLSREAGASTATFADGSRIEVGVQPLLLAALGALVLGLLLSLLSFALRGLAVAAAAVAAIVLLLVSQGQVGSQIIEKIPQIGNIPQSVSSSIAGPQGGDVSNYFAIHVANIPSYFTVTTGIGLILAVVALGFVALYNLAAQFAALLSGGTRAGPATDYETDVGASPGE